MKFCIPVNSRKVLRPFVLKVSYLDCLQFVLSVICVRHVSLDSQQIIFIHLSSDSARCKPHCLVVYRRKISFAISLWLGVTQFVICCYMRSYMYHSIPSRKIFILCEWFGALSTLHFIVQ